MTKLSIHPTKTEDLPRLDEIRKAAFAPVFASFKSLLGEEVYKIAQASSDEAQGQYLVSLVEPNSGWEVYTAKLEGVIVGFVSIKLDNESKIGEIGLNAVHPDYAGKGIGTDMYAFAIQRMKEAGMQVATVSTGGDSSHAPARRAYEKAGFDVYIPSVWMCQKL